MISQVQAAEMRFLRRVHVVMDRDKVRSREIRKGLNVEPLLIQIDKSQFSWFCHVAKISQERKARQSPICNIHSRIVQRSFKDQMA